MRIDPRKDGVPQLVTGDPNNRDSAFTTTTEQTRATNQTNGTFEFNGSVSPTIIYPIKENSVRVIDDSFPVLKKGVTLEERKALLRKQIIGLQILSVFLIVVFIASLVLAFI